MTDRDRLIELMGAVQSIGVKYTHEETASSMGFRGNAELADYLISNGVILPPCKVGQVVWVHWYNYKDTKPKIESRKILSVQIYKNGDIQYHYKDGCFWQGHFGITVFLTKEEAEKALKEREEK